MSWLSSRIHAWVVVGSIGFCVAVPSHAGVIRVKQNAGGANNGTSWANAFTDLQSALSSAVTGDEIWVAAGVYRPDRGGRDRQATFSLKAGVGHYGGFVGTETQRDQRDPDPETNGTILSGDLAGNDRPGDINLSDNSYHVVTADGDAARIGNTTILDGFTIRAGYADDNFPNEAGAGLLNIVAAPTVRNCLFVDNVAIGAANPGLGGAIFNESSDVVVSNCIFRSNRASRGGAINNFASNPTINNCTFVANSTDRFGGAIYNFERSGGQFRNCHFEDNTSEMGGALALLNGSDPVITGCTFTANAAIGRDGGAVHIEDSRPRFFACVFQGNVSDRDGGAISNASRGVPLVVNCVFSGNRAERGGAFLNNSGDATLTHCTLVGNVATMSGGGFENVRSGNPTVANCILVGNRLAGQPGTPSQFSGLGGFPFLAFTCIEGGWTGPGGIGVIDADPLFLRNPDDGGDGWGVGNNDDFGDLRLPSGSPCVDAGDNGATQTANVQTDVLGNPRFVDDPDTDDTGQGSAPLVDMGAYELQEVTAPELVQIADGFGGVNEMTGLADTFISPWADNCPFAEFSLEATEPLTLNRATVTYTGTGATPRATLIDNGDGRHTVRLAPAPEPGEWVKITLEVAGKDSGQDAVLIVWVAHQPLDINQDGTTNIRDASIFGEEFHGRAAGTLIDTNCDGRVDVRDASAFGATWTTWGNTRLPQKPL